MPPKTWTRRSRAASNAAGRIELIEQIGLIGLIRLTGDIGLISPISLISPICPISPISPLGLIGLIGLIAPLSALLYPSIPVGIEELLEIFNLSAQVVADVGVGNEHPVRRHLHDLGETLDVGAALDGILLARERLVLH